MNRAEELTDRLIDGTLTDAEATELELLLAADPTARDHHLALLDLEAALRGMRGDLDLAAATIARIEAERADRTVSAVMSSIADRPAPARARRRRGWRAIVGTVLATAAAVLVVAVWLARPPRDVSPDAHRIRPASTVFARLTAFSGNVEVIGLQGPVAANSDQLLAPGQTVRTVGEESLAVVEFPDRTRIELHADSAVRLASDNASGDAPRRLFLEQGQVTAVVSGRPITVGTGAADVVARRGRFSLWSSGPGSARVELQEGDVELVRGDDLLPVSLTPGRAAFIRHDLEAVQVESAYRVDATPLDRLDFRGALDVVFTSDGKEVWAASAKQWMRWRIGNADGVQKVLFAPPAHNDGPVAIIAADRRSLVACRVDDREANRTVIRDLPAGSVRQVIPVRASEPRFMCIAPDASWVAVTKPKPNARVRVWDGATGRERFSRDLEANAFCMASTPDGQLLAMDVSDLGRGSNNKVVLLDVETGALKFSLPTRRRQVTAISFSADGKRMAAGFNGAVQIWNVAERRLERTIDGFERVVTRLKFAPDGRLVAAGTQDGQVWIWNEVGQRTQVIDTGTRGIRAMAFSPDGKFLVTATNKATVAVWEVAPEPVKQPEPDA